MAERVNAYLGEDAAKELDRLTEGLGQLLGYKVSRSAAIASLLVNQAGIYLEARRRMATFENEIRTWPQYDEAKRQLAEEAEA